jgi:protein gp37
MAETTGISWADATFNPWIGCTKVSPACANCYAERDFDIRYGRVKWGPRGSRMVTSESNWHKPVKWNRDAERDGVRKRVFCASLADIFEDWQGPMYKSSGAQLFNYSGNGGWWDQTENIVGMGEGALTMQDVRNRLFMLIDSTPNLDWLVLTKRPENILRMTPPAVTNLSLITKGVSAIYRENLWLGTSVENQEYADSRIPELLKCRDMARILFLSCEPMVGPVDFSDVTKRSDAVSQLGKKALDGINWVICGGESGPGARPCDPNWFRSLRNQCAAAGVCYHFKQWGEFDENEKRVGVRAAGRTLDGVIHDGVPLQCN